MRGFASGQRLETHAVFDDVQIHGGSKKFGVQGRFNKIAHILQESDCRQPRKKHDAPFSIPASTTISTVRQASPLVWASVTVLLPKPPRLAGPLARTSG